MLKIPGALVLSTLLGAHMCANPYAGYSLGVVVDGGTSACVEDALAREFGEPEDYGWHYWPVAAPSPEGRTDTRLKIRLKREDAIARLEVKESWYVGKVRNLVRHEKEMAQALAPVMTRILTECEVPRDLWIVKCESQPGTSICPKPELTSPKSEG